MDDEKADLWNGINVYVTNIDDNKLTAMPKIWYNRIVKILVYLAAKHNKLSAEIWRN